jgi:kumamolisin
LVPLRGSRRTAVPGARRVADADPDEAVTVTIVVRRRRPLDGHAPRPLGAAATREERVALRRRFVARHGASRRDLDAVDRYVRTAGLSGIETSRARRTVTAQGAVRQMNAAFGVNLGEYQAAGVRYRGRVGRICIPRHLDGIVEAVFGLDERVQARPRHKSGDAIPEAELPDPGANPRDILESATAAALAAAATAAPNRNATAKGDGASGTTPPPEIRFWPAQVGRLYDFPTGVDGSGETIAIIALGGRLGDADVTGFFSRAEIETPHITTVPVDAVHARNVSSDAAIDLDREVMLDVAIAGSIAPKAALVVYLGGTQNDQTFFNTITAAIHDAEHVPSIISISWGLPERAWTRQARDAVDAAFADAAALRVTVLCAAGDHGAAGDGMLDDRAQVDFPGASPNVLACGGTTLTGIADGVVSECTWNNRNGWATGGGVSECFTAPPWQSDIRKRLRRRGSKKHGRGVPDVAANADPRSGYVMPVHGAWHPVGGTSAVAPLYAGLCALINQATHSAAGALAPALYALHTANAARVFRDVTIGDNSVPASGGTGAVKGYRARTGWDACTGLGSLNGRALLASLA